MRLTTKNIAKRLKVVDLSGYSASTKSQIEEKWNFSKSANLTLDLWTGEENMRDRDILKVDMLEPHNESNHGSGYAYLYFSDDRLHYIQRKKIYANTKGLYIATKGRPYLNFPAIDIKE